MFQNSTWKKLNTYTLLLILNLIEITNYGTIMLSNNYVDKETTKILKSISCIFYLLSTFLAQIFFNIFSKMCIISGPFSEISVITNQIMVKSYFLNSKDFILNGIVCIIISTFLFGLLSIFTIKLSKYFNYIPYCVCHGIMFGTGLMEFEIAYMMMPNKWYLYALIIAFCIFSIKVYYNRNIIFLVTIFLVCYIHISKNFYTFVEDIEYLNGLKYLKNLQLSDISFNIQKKLFSKAISIACFCYLQLPANHLSYESMTKSKHSVSNQLKTQGLSNIICTISIFPVYFICPYTVLVRNANFTKFDTYFIAILFFLTVLFVNPALKVIPIFIQCLYSLTAGVEFCYDYSISTFNNSYIEFLVCSIVGVISFFSTMEKSFIIGLLTYFGFLIFFRSVNIEEREGICIICPVYLFLKEFDINKQTILDCTNIKFIDMNSKSDIDEMICKNNIVFINKSKVIENEEAVDFQSINEGIEYFKSLKVQKLGL